MIIKQGSWWKYVGHGDGRGLRHCVCFVEGPTITTWSEMGNIQAIERGGFSWYGPVGDFLKQFMPVAKP